MSQPFPPDTICAIATPLGKGGLGVVRLSGPEAIAVAERLFHRRRNDAAAERSLTGHPSHTVHHGWMTDPATGAVIDEVLLTLFRAPHSYTREESVEISGHGGPAVMAQLLSACLASGARLAEPGEFTKRAFLNGRLDLTQAEAVMALIEAESASAHRLALRQLRGDVAGALRALRDALLLLLADCEASLDFVEEGLTHLPAHQLQARLLALRQEILRLARSADLGRILKNGVRAVIAGRPNVGKSSLFNRLLGQHRAIVTPYPGTTRDLIEETITIEGLPLRLIDTAGLRDSEHPIEREGIDRARASWTEADLLLLVLDASEPLTDDDWRLIEQTHSTRAIAVFNKIDLSVPRDEAALASSYPELPRVWLSATEGTGCEQLKQAILERFTTDGGALTGQVIISHARHVQSLQAAGEAIGRALEAVDGALSSEFIASDIKEAVHQLALILGTREAISEELLGQIFSQFCIGK